MLRMVRINREQKECFCVAGLNQYTELRWKHPLLLGLGVSSDI